MDQAIRLTGAIMILAAFAAAQLGMLAITSRAYLVLNLLGSALLAVTAVREEQWGFALLQTAWALVSAWSLAQLLRGSVPVAPGH